MAWVAGRELRPMTARAVWKRIFAVVEVWCLRGKRVWMLIQDRTQTLLGRGRIPGFILGLSWSLGSSVRISELPYAACNAISTPPTQRFHPVPIGRSRDREPGRPSRSYQPLWFVGASGGDTRLVGPVFPPTAFSSRGGIGGLSTEYS